ncbi:MAG TPA: GAF domain-containing protein, partial [Thermoanaerobaculia bacterium]
MSGSPRDRRSIWRVGPESTWTTILPVVFIIASLISLVILPLAVSNHTKRMRREISRIAEPARRSANAIQISLASELDKIIAYQTTGQSQYRREYFELLRAEEANRKVLQQLAPQLDEELERTLAALFVEASRWHEGTRRNELVVRQLPNEVFLARMFEQHAAYEKALHAATEVELSIQDAIESRLEKIREAETLNVSLTIILTLLALTSALLVATLGRQMRLLANEATRRRQEAEREANESKLARAAAELEERRAAFLASAGQELATSLDYEETVRKLAHLIVPNLAELCVVDMVQEDGSLLRVAAAHRNPEDDLMLQPMVGTVRRDVPNALTQIMKSRDARLLGGTSGLFPYITGEEDGRRTLMLIPLVSRGQTLGLIAAASPQARPFVADDLPLFVELARHASLAIDNARLYQDSQQAVRAREEVLAIV